MIIKVSRPLIASSAVAIPIFLSLNASAAGLTPIELLGKHMFFDKISTPDNKQACVSCHDPAVGWVLPNSRINSTTVVAPGAAPHALGNIKPPSNAYAKFSPPFRFQPFGGFEGISQASAETLAPRSFQGGSFWDGRAEGYGKTGPSSGPVGNGAVSDTVTVDDIPLSRQAQYAQYLGPMADQALNPFVNNAEQNASKGKVCQAVKKARYHFLYKMAYGKAIDCAAGLETSYKRVALALAAWQSSREVNQFSSKRDRALALDADKKFPLKGLTAQENLGHDLFYGRNDSGQNPAGKNAGCAVCHNSGVRTSDGTETDQIYTNHRYQHIGLPYNFEIPGVGKGAKTGLTEHVSVALAALTGAKNDIPILPGYNRTPTLRNVAAPNGFIKAYGHNGYFKSLEQIVHFYNTSLVYKENCPAAPSTDSSTVPVCTDDPNATPDKNSTAATWPGGPITRCPDDLTASQAIEAGCWPEPEFPDATAQSLGTIGNLHLTQAEEEALVQYMKTFTDQHPVRKP